VGRDLSARLRLLVWIRNSRHHTAATPSCTVFMVASSYSVQTRPALSADLDFGAAQAKSLRKEPTLMPVRIAGRLVKRVGRLAERVGRVVTAIPRMLLGR
jgi:hypothetical protein